VNRELVQECVHCGFCLPTCPTYQLWHEEMDSPRGRIYLMEQLLDGTIRLNETVTQHFDRCLGCMACVTACPSGVQYDRLIELTRAHVEREIERPRRERALRRLIFTVLPNPRRMRVALALEPLGRRMPVPATLRPLLEIAPPWRSSATPPAVTSPAGRPVARVGLLLGCVQRVVFGDVNAATARVLAADGYEVVAPRRQRCCGALAVHAGRLDEGLDRARRLIDVFERERVDLVVTNAAGCGSNLRDYVHLLADDPRYAERAAAFSAKVRDVSEVVSDTVSETVSETVSDTVSETSIAVRSPSGRAERRPLPLRVAFQDSCHLLHAQRVREAPRRMLAAIPGLSVAEPADQELCCGSAGIYNLVQPDAARELGERKAANVLATAPDVYASANPGCLIQVSAALRRAGRELPALHPIELVDASIRGLDPDAVLRNARR
jgi:glycolate oxidase iron-sulfur subunit